MVTGKYSVELPEVEDGLAELDPFLFNKNFSLKWTETIRCLVP
jgi:hypothetical protein